MATQLLNWSGADLDSIWMTTNNQNFILPDSLPGDEFYTNNGQRYDYRFVNRWAGQTYINYPGRGIATGFLTSTGNDIGTHMVTNGERPGWTPSWVYGVGSHSININAIGNGFVNVLLVGAGGGAAMNMGQNTGPGGNGGAGGTVLAACIYLHALPMNTTSINLQVGTGGSGGTGNNKGYGGVYGNGNIGGATVLSFMSGGTPVFLIAGGGGAGLRSDYLTFSSGITTPHGSSGDCINLNYPYKYKKQIGSGRAPAPTIGFNDSEYLFPYTWTNSGQGVGGLSPNTGNEPGNGERGLDGYAVLYW